MSKYQITPAEHPLDFCRPDYSSRPVKPLAASLVFDPAESALNIDFRHEIDPTPMRAWHGLVCRYPIPACANAVSLTEDINNGEFDALLDRIAAGHSTEWDGHNWVGQLTQGAEGAELDLAARLEEYEDDSLGGLWDAGDWLYDARHELGITNETTDDDLTALASKLEQEALNENAKLYGTMEALEAIRQECPAPRKEGTAMIIPEWVQTATKEQVVAIAAKMADRLQDLRLATDESWDCSKGGGCPACRPDSENCELRQANEALIEWQDGPGNNNE